MTESQTDLQGHKIPPLETEETLRPDQLPALRCQVPADFQKIHRTRAESKPKTITTE
jgi:hypothetical protein